ncbi:hypothetical protein Tco_0698763 [Tanacetum coccineum]
MCVKSPRYGFTQYGKPPRKALHLRGRPSTKLEQRLNPRSPSLSRSSCQNRDRGHVTSCHIVYCPIIGVPTQKTTQATIDMDNISNLLREVEPKRKK